MPNEITKEELASMVQDGFEGTAKSMDDGFRGLNQRLDRIEQFILENHESRMRRIEEALGFPKSR